MSSLPYRVSVSSGSLYHFPLGQFFALAARLDIDGIELVIGPECVLRGAGSVRGMAAKHGVSILSLHPPIVPLPGWTRLGVLTERLERWAAELGAPVVTLHTPRIATLDSDSGRRYMELASDLAGRLAQTGSRLALENRARYSRNPGPECLDRPDDLLALAQTWHAGVTFDTAHAGTMYSDILETYQVLSPGLANVHFSDLAASGSRPASIWVETVQQHHQIPGSGTLPLRGLVQRLQADQYCGPVTLELSPFALGLWNPGRARRLLEQSVAFLRGNQA